MREPGWLLRESQARIEAAIRTKDELRSYQRDLLVPFLLAHPRSAAYVDMGLGKTISVLTVVEELLTHEQIEKVLIIAPLRVAVQTWPTEIADWRHTAWMTHTLIRHDEQSPEVTSAMRTARKVGDSPSKARTKVFQEQLERAALSPQSVHIVNRERVEWLVEFLGKRWPYNMVVVDEATSFKDHRTKRWKALARVAQRTERIHLLSGTPAPEGIEDLFAQIALLDGGKRFGRSITAFRERFMVQHPYTRQWRPQPGAVERVTELISDITLTMQEADYLDIAKPILVERPVVLEAKELRQYKDFERELILQLKDAEIEAVNAGVLSGKLLQYASGAVYDENRNVHEVHNHKIAELQQIVEENPGQPLLVCYWFKSTLSRLRKSFPQAVMMDREGNCIADWNSDKIPMLLVHPQSAGHGIQLQLGSGHTIIFVDTPPGLESYVQMVKRISRSGQKRVVRVVHIVTRGTLDALAVGKLKNKESAQNAIISHLRELRKQLKGRKE